METQAKANQELEADLRLMREKHAKSVQESEAKILALRREVRHSWRGALRI